MKKVNVKKTKQANNSNLCRSEKEFVCHICGKKFLQNGDHIGRRRYCEECYENIILPARIEHAYALVNGILSLKVGEECYWQGYRIRAFFYEERLFIEPDIVGGWDVYKGGKYLKSIDSVEELETFCEELYGIKN